MAPLPSRIEVQVGDTYESLKIKREQLLNGPNPPTAVPSDQDLFHAALRVRILQDIACIHAQIEHKYDTDVSVETTQDFSDLAEEYKHSIQQIQLLQSKIGLKDPVVGSLLPEGSESLDILDIPVITRINFYRGGLGRPVLENIPKAIRFDERIKLDREDVTVHHVSEIRRALELYQKVHRALEVEASECRIALLQHIQESDNDFDLSSIMSRIGMKPGNGDIDVVSNISSPITETSIHQEEDESILLAPTSEKNHATEPVATSKKKRRRVRGRNRRNKKASLNRGDSQHSVVSVEDPAVSREDLSTSIEGPEGSFGDPAVLVEDPAVSAEGPAASAEEHTSIADIGNLALSNAALPTNPVSRPTTSGSNVIAHLPPTGFRPVDTRSRELLNSRGKTLVEAVDCTRARALESSLAQVTTPSSNNELNEGHAQTEISEMDERKKLVKQAKNRRKKAWQRRRRGMKSKLKEANSSVNAPRSLSPVRDTCLPSPLVAGIEIPKKNFLEEQQPQSAPPVPLECPSTTTVDGPSQNNEWNRPASAAAHLPQIQNTNSAFEYVAVGSAAGSPHISVWEDENNEDQVTVAIAPALTVQLCRFRLVRSCADSAVRSPADITAGRAWGFY
ncbi:hypothetical protein N7475_003475 [Penicillium sp. IBT 31633x]|nr:hypothetical protein N7475_003475 [Penicillium sp. IBT 31633x]